MEHLARGDVMTMFLALAVLLGVAKLAGELILKLDQPAVLGEIIAGILLGPTLLGRFKPAIYAALFPSTGSLPVVLDAITTIGVVLFLLTAGIEVELSSVFRQGKGALLVSSLGVVIPFGLGFAAAFLFPRFLGAQAGADRLIFSLFVGTALSISALPVIAKILMDLNLLRSEMGTLVVSSAMFNDLAGWILFSLVLGMMTAGSHNLSSIRHTVILVLAFVALLLTAGRWLIDKLLLFIQAHSTWPGGVLGLIFTLTLGAAAFTEYAGIHAIFGGFIMGVAIGESRHLRQRTSQSIQQVVGNVFAPLFFVSIGLRTDFVTNFNFPVTATVIAVACLGKLLGGVWGARLGGFDRRSAWGVGFAMNARGAMEMILGILALQAGLIREPMFVALVIMALFTSLVSAPAMRFLISRQRTLGLKDAVSGKLFLAEITAGNRRGAIEQLCQLAAPTVGNVPERFLRLAWNREQVAPSGWHNGLAVPHARVLGLTQPLVVVGKSRDGIDFDARDGKLARVIVLILTGDTKSQHDLLADASEVFARKEAVEQAINARDFVEFVAALNAPVK